MAENLLKEYYPEILENSIPLSVTDLVRRLNLNLVEVTLTTDKSVLGKMVFKDSEVDVIVNGKNSKLFVKGGTILVDPEIKEIRNEGSYNNTIVHECVHWIMHRINNEYNFILREKYDIKINLEDREWIDAAYKAGIANIDKMVENDEMTIDEAEKTPHGYAWSEVNKGDGTVGYKANIYGADGISNDGK